MIGMIGMIALGTCRQCLGCDPPEPAPAVASPAGNQPRTPPQPPAAEFAARANGTCGARIMRQGGHAGGEPIFTGGRGYIRAEPPLSTRGRIPWRKPWTASAMERTGPDKWRPVGVAMEHKTSVRVRSQALSHTLRGYYAGLLVVEFPDGSQREIEPEQFVEYPYWACPVRRRQADSAQWTTGRAYVVAKLKEGQRAVDSNGDWVEWDAREHLLCDVSTHNYDGKLDCQWLDRRDRFVKRVAVEDSDILVVY